MSSPLDKFSITEYIYHYGGKNLDLSKKENFWNADKTIYTFFNIRTNETFIGMKLQFVRNHTELKRKYIYDIVKHRTHSTKGWKVIDSNTFSRGTSEPINLTLQIPVQK